MWNKAGKSVKDLLTPVSPAQGHRRPNQGLRPDGVDITQDKFCCKIPPSGSVQLPTRKSPQELIWSLGTLSLRLAPKGDRWSSCPTQRGCGWVEKSTPSYSSKWNVSHQEDTACVDGGYSSSSAFAIPGTWYLWPGSDTGALL